jgi:predicted short-subunit dehydrogenase-like oxidoreductase (DUF2520 family)
MIAECRFAIIGAGLAGRSLAWALSARGARVAAVASRRMESARAAAELAPGAQATTDAVAAARLADAVVLSVPDDAISAVCEQIARGGGFRHMNLGASVEEDTLEQELERGTPGTGAGLGVPRPVEGRGMPRPYLGVREEASRDRKYVLHLSGTLGSEVLAAAREAGAFPLAFHPVQTFAAPGPRLFEGITCAVEGDREAVAFGRELAEFLGARPVEVRREDKALYHAGLAVACNYLVALAEAGRALLERAGLGPTALDALLPLLRGTVENLARVGLPGALTGPISRADLATLRAHLDALRERAPEFLPLYRILGSRTVDLALRKGTIDERQAAEMRRLLEAP